MVNLTFLSSVQKAHLSMMDSLMTLAASEAVDHVKMAAEAEQMGVGAPWENSLLFWVNRVRPQKLSFVLVLCITRAFKNQDEYWCGKIFL